MPRPPVPPTRHLTARERTVRQVQLAVADVEGSMKVGLTHEQRLTALARAQVDATLALVWATLAIADRDRVPAVGE